MPRLVHPQLQATGLRLGSPATPMRHRHDKIANGVFRTIHGLGAGTLCLDDEDVSVWQRINSPRTVKAGGIGRDSEAWRNARRFTRLPADHLGNADCRDQLFSGLGQHRVGPDLLRGVDRLRIAARSQGNDRSAEEEPAHHAPFSTSGWQRTSR